MSEGRRPLDQDHLTVLVNRLYDACANMPDFGVDVWRKGIEVLERKHGCMLWLSAWEPAAVSMDEETMKVVMIPLEDGKLGEGFVKKVMKEEV